MPVVIVNDDGSFDIVPSSLYDFSDENLSPEPDPANCDSPRTAVNQGTDCVGDDYPFILPTVFQCLITDLYLSYETDEEFELDFRLAWLHGFGVSFSSEVAVPTPVHAREVLIKDAVGGIVFDSTQATTFFETTFGVYTVSTWIKADSVFKMSWVNPGSDPGWFINMYPDLAIDARTYSKVPKRVRSIRVGATAMKSQIRIQNGYNTSLLFTPTRQTAVRDRSKIIIRASPGDGLGRVPGCAEPVVNLFTINGVYADSAGNFSFDNDNCFKIQIPVTREGNEGTYGNEDLTEEEAKHALQISNDCTACCPCDFFVRTYKGVSRMWDKWQLVTSQLESIRDTYADNRNRWNDQRDCRINNPAKLNVSSPGGCTLDVSATYCNLTENCLQPVEIRIKLTAYNGSTEYTPSLLGCISAYISGSHTQGEETYNLAGSWPQYFAVYPYVNPQDTIALKARFCLDGCTVNTSVKVELSVHTPTPAPNWKDEVPTLPNLGTGFGSAYPIRALVESQKPLVVDPFSSTCCL